MIRTTVRGQRVLAPEVTDALMATARNSTGADLTQRERELLGLMARGLSNQEISKRLSIAMPTVKFHVTNIPVSYTHLDVYKRQTANTTVARDAVNGLLHADEAGGLSGAPVFEASNRVIRLLRAALGPAYPIIGVGGVMSAEDALAKRAAGADLVQIYTGLIYRGSALVPEAARALQGR